MCKLESEQRHKETHLVDYPIGVNGRKYDVQAFEIGVMTKVKRQLQGIKGMNKRDELGELITCHMELLNYNLAKDYVESICNIYL